MEADQTSNHYHDIIVRTIEDDKRLEIKSDDCRG